MHGYQVKVQHQRPAIMTEVDAIHAVKRQGLENFGSGEEMLVEVEWEQIVQNSIAPPHLGAT